MSKTEVDDLIDKSPAWASIYWALCDASHLNSNKCERYAVDEISEAIEYITQQFNPRRP